MQNDEQNTLINSLATELLKEKRSARRWKTFRSLAWLALIAFISVSVFRYINGTNKSDSSYNGKYVSLIRLDGMIAPGRDFSSDTVIPVLKDAFADKRAEGVIIDINSPGGTPVQAAIIHDAIMTFKKRYHKKVIVIGEDTLASGAYYVAVSADKIYVNPNTLTGSIGVIMKSFGFVDLIKKLGVERRVYFAGAEKDRLDPFLPQNPQDIEKIKEVISEVHNNFIQAVAEGRKGKLHGTPEQLFNGDFWSGQTAFKLGLVDGLGNLMDVMEKEFGTSQFEEYSVGSPLLHMLGGQLNNAMDSVAYLYA